MHTGFLPYLPHPIPEHSRTFTALHNFLKILWQLNQTALPIFYDEGVSHTVFDIVLSSPKEFDNLIPCLAASTQQRLLNIALVKYLHRSGVENALVETGVFGVKAVESHYIRSLRRIIILADALSTLKWKAFWKTNDGADFDDILSVADQLKIVFKER